MLLLASSGVLAFSQNDNIQTVPIDPETEETPKISLATAVSLFNLIYLVEEKSDTTEYDNNGNRNKIMDFIHVLF
jgi:hypothetical protein